MPLTLRLTAPVFVVLLASCSPGNSAGASSAPASTEAHTVTIMDDYYHMPAGSVGVPGGWKYSTTVMRVPGCHGSPFLSIQFTVANPDGLTAAAALPGATWQYSTSPQIQRNMAQNKCPGINITTAADFLASVVVPNLHPGATIIKVGPGGSLVQQNVKAGQAGAQAAGQKPSVTGAAVRIRYDIGGHPIEEELSSVVSCSVFHSIAMFAAPASTTTTCSTFGIGVAWAPQGQLDQFLNGRYNSILQSAKTDPAWLHRMVGDQQKRFQQATADFNRVSAENLAQMKAREDALVKHAQEQMQVTKSATDRSMANAQASQDARTRAARQVVNFASDRADYLNPATGQVLNLDYNANHSWGSTDGQSVVLNGSSTYDPNGSVYPVQSSWVELVPVH